MKLLTLTQPWAQLIALGAKQIETRSWEALWRGPIAIHAAKNLNPVGGERGLEGLYLSPPFYEVLWQAHGVTLGDLLDARGCIVAVAELVDCRLTAGGYERDRADDPLDYRIGYVGQSGGIVAVPDHERVFGDYSPGRFAWLLADVRPLRAPLPCRGAQGLRDLPAEVTAEVLARAGEVAPP